MYDPFPFKSPQFLADAAAKLGDRLGLETLPLHAHEVLVVAGLYHVACSVVSPAFSRTFFPKYYNAFNRRTRVNWDVHVVSLVQSIAISAAALWVMAVDEQRQKMDFRDRIWGYTGGLGLITSLAAGYFVWDLYISLVYVDIFGLGLLAHAVCALWVFALGYRPFVNFYAPTFILFELSTPFLNIHWFCDKLNLTGSTLQLINGILLMAVFFGSRLVWGVWQAFAVFYDIFRAYQYQHTKEGAAWLALNGVPIGVGEAAEVRRYASNKEFPFWLAVTYLTSNIVLTLLNIHWFGKMVATVRKRFPPPFGTKRDAAKPHTIQERGIDDAGTKSVSVSATEVRAGTGATQRRPVPSRYETDNPPPN